MRLSCESCGADWEADLCENLYEVALHDIFCPECGFLNSLHRAFRLANPNLEYEEYAPWDKPL